MRDISNKSLVSVYDEIKSKWRENGYSNRVLELDSSAIGAATGSEAIFLQGKYLVDLEKIDIVAFDLVKEETADFISLCKKAGLILNTATLL